MLFWASTPGLATLLAQAVCAITISITAVPDLRRFDQSYTVETHAQRASTPTTDRESRFTSNSDVQDSQKPQDSSCKASGGGFKASRGGFKASGVDSDLQLVGVCDAGAVCVRHHVPEA
eukprot:8985887-Pyramimonas_sp.AAC.1